MRRRSSPGADFLRGLVPAVTAASAAFGLAGRVRRLAGGLDILRRRLEQHHLHRRRSEKSASRCAALAGVGHGHRHHALFPGQRGLSAHACRWRKFRPPPTTAWPPPSCKAIFGSAGRRHHGRRDHDFHLRLRQRLDPGRRARLLRHGARRLVLPLHRPAERARTCLRRDCVLQGYLGGGAGAGANPPGGSAQPAR